MYFLYVHQKSMMATITEKTFIRGLKQKDVFINLFFSEISKPFEKKLVRNIPMMVVYSVFI